MRHTLRALVGMVFIGWCCCHAAAEESGSRWWQFGRNRDAEISQPADTVDLGKSRSAPVGQQTHPSQQWNDADAKPRWMISSPQTKVSWPRVHMPEIPKPRLPWPQVLPKKHTVDDSRNAWVEQRQNASKPSPVEAMTGGARRVGNGARTAWHKTVDFLTPGESGSARTARREPRPSIWQRMFGAQEPQQQGPQTVSEWMAQERLDP